MENVKVIPVAVGYYAIGKGAGREIVAFGRTEVEAKNALQVGQEQEPPAWVTPNSRRTVRGPKGAS